MSRKSSAYGGGNPKFTWRVEKVEHPNQEGAFKATCETHPEIYAYGDSETQAIRLANTRMEQAVDKAEI